MLTKSLSLVLLLLVASVVLGQAVNDVSKLGLTGPVKSVVRERVKLETQKSKIVEGPRELVKQWSFNLQGLIIESSDNSILGTERFDYRFYQNLQVAQRINLTDGGTYVFAYDKGKVTRYFMTEAFGVLISRDMYLYDGNDQLASIEHTCYYRQLCSFGPRVILTYFKRDERGRVVEEAVFDAAGNPYIDAFGVHRFVTTYLDDRTREVSAFGRSGISIGRWQYKVDDSSFEQERIEFGRTLVPTSRFVVLERDDQHNWTKIRRFRLSNVNGKAIEEPTYDEYQQITYY